MSKQWESAGLFRGADTAEQRARRVMTSIYREALTDERRLSLAGVGLIRWSVELPDDLAIPEAMRQSPWNFTDSEARHLIGFLLDELRPRRAVNMPEGASAPNWDDISSWPQRAYCLGTPGKRRNVSQWDSPSSAAGMHLLPPLAPRTAFRRRRNARRRRGS